MPPAIKRGRKEHTTSDRPRKTAKTVTAGEGRITRQMAATARAEQINAKFFGNFDIQEIILVLLPAEDLISVSAVSRTYRNTVETSVRLQKKLFMVADATHEYVEGDRYAPHNVSKRLIEHMSGQILSMDFSFIYARPHLNHLIFFLNDSDKHVLQQFTDIHKRGIFLGDMLYTAFDVWMEVYHALDPTSTPEDWLLSPVKIHLIAGMWRHGRSAKPNKWREEWSCNKMFLTQPPIKELSCTLIMRSSDRYETPKKHVTVRSKGGVTFADVMKLVQTFRVEGEKEFKRMESRLYAY